MKDLATLQAALTAADAGRWAEAHELVQDLDGPLAAWIHANLHREEGDEGNASYWYGRACRTFSRRTCAEERREIAAVLGAAG
jgi:hypothetical protein